MKRYLFTLLVPVLMFTLSVQAKSAPEDKKCTDCHSAVIAGKIKHSPVVQGCDVCHKSNGKEHPVADAKAFSLAKETPDLCYTCHTPKNTKTKVHSPVANGKCMLCHQVHSSDNAFLLKENPVGTTCLECHDDLEIAENKSQHSPVVGGKCNECHDPHQTDTEKLLKQEGNDLCLKCHSSQKAALALKSVHPPFVNKCGICHKPHGSKEEHMLTTKLPDLCWGCHDDLQYDFDKSQFPHKALKEGKTCSNCHSPHASANDSLIKFASISESCYACHDLKIKEKKNIHAPVRNGKCQECHDPHFSDNKNLVKGETTVLCVKCHEQAAKELTMANVHPPFKNKCSICHNAHASDEGKLLTKNVTELCVGCHDDFEEPMQKPANVHGPLKDAKSCANCHSPHASPTEKILLADEKTTCLKCHGKSLRKGNRALVNIKQLLQKSKYIHGAIATKGCSGCHNPHFSENSNLLVAKFADGFYMAGVQDSFALCFTCHDSQLMLAQKTTTVTSFRNGDKNLHFVHVNGKKARSCSVCHEVHASNNLHLITEKTKFGDWDMKMNFEPKDGGGSCQTGCHEVKVYKR